MTPKYYQYNVPASADMWYENLQPYMKNTQVQTCPSQSATALSYGVNWRHVICYPAAHSSLGKEVGLAEFQKPAETLVLADSHTGTTGEGSAGCAAIYCPHCYATPPYSYVNYAVSSRHNDGANCAYLDGHAKWEKTQNILRTDASSIWAH
ncbi:MAG TPA: hypothetical protein DGT21_24725 [Armatimonadetes bacterium]|nr:hypothetical protein [Armatimonadota bacterium]